MSLERRHPMTVESFLQSMYYSTIYEKFKQATKNSDDSLDDDVKSLFSNETFQNTDAICYDTKIPKNRPENGNDPIKKLRCRSSTILTPETVDWIFDQCGKDVKAAQEKINKAESLKARFPAINVEGFSFLYYQANCDIGKMKDLFLRCLIDQQCPYFGGLLALRPELTAIDFKTILKQCNDCKTLKELYDRSLDCVPPYQLQTDDLTSISQSQTLFFPTSNNHRLPPRVQSADCRFSQSKSFLPRDLFLAIDLRDLDLKDAQDVLNQCFGNLKGQLIDSFFIINPMDGLEIDHAYYPEEWQDKRVIQIWKQGRRRIVP